MERGRESGVYTCQRCVAMILAADIGGTNARLGVFESSRTRLLASATATYPS
jgi:glucokinase